jgi:hypothetical protein
MPELGDNRLIGEIENFLAGKEVPPAAPEPKRQRRPRRHPLRALRRRLARTWAHRGVRIAAVVTVVAVVFAGQQWRGRAGSGTDHASTAPAGPGYSFLQINPGGAPVRWNPCKAIRYQTNLAEAPPNARVDLTEAIARLARATGLRFVDAGSTKVIPTTRYGVGSLQHPKPVIMAWATPAETDGLGKRPADLATPGIELGRGGAVAVREVATGHAVFVSGSVVIDAHESAALNPGFGPDSLGIVLMHELGHTVGLGHVDDPSQIMNLAVVPTKPADWGPGDLAGLTRLGVSSGCLSTPKRSTVPVYLTH